MDLTIFLATKRKENYRTGSVKYPMLHSCESWSSTSLNLIDYWYTVFLLNIAVVHVHSVLDHVRSGVVGPDP